MNIIKFTLSYLCIIIMFSANSYGSGGWFHIVNAPDSVMPIIRHEIRMMTGDSVHAETYRYFYNALYRYDYQFQPGLYVSPSLSVHGAWQYFAYDGKRFCFFPNARCYDVQKEFETACATLCYGKCEASLRRRFYEEVYDTCEMQFVDSCDVFMPVAVEALPQEGTWYLQRDIRNKSDAGIPEHDDIFVQCQIKSNHANLYSRRYRIVKAYQYNSKVFVILKRNKRRLLLSRRQ